MRVHIYAFLDFNNQCDPYRIRYRQIMIRNTEVCAFQINGRHTGDPVGLAWTSGSVTSHPRTGEKPSGFSVFSVTSRLPALTRNSATAPLEGERRVYREGWSQPESVRAIDSPALTVVLRGVGNAEGASRAPRFPESVRGFTPYAAGLLTYTRCGNGSPPWTDHKRVTV